jgi:hypothetical protein
MNKFTKSNIFSAAFIILALFTATLAQTTGLPKIRKGETYKSVRVKMIKAGWKPYHSPDAVECSDGDERCQGRPEMEDCADTGLGNCRFLWKRKGKTVAIFTVGDNTVFDGSELLKN